MKIRSVLTSGLEVIHWLQNILNGNGGGNSSPDFIKSTISKYYGTKSHCCAHFIGVNGNDSDESVCLTEGIMKADIAYCLSRSSGYPHGFVGLTGVSNKTQLAAAFTALSSLGKRRILVMYDADYRTNDAVRKLREYAITAGKDCGFDMVPVSWDPTYKGIDDLLLSKKRA